MNLIAIDPGSERSGWALFRDSTFSASSIEDNEFYLPRHHFADTDDAYLAIEYPEASGMPVSNQLFKTVEWIGRFLERWNNDKTVIRVTRRMVKSFICGSQKARDSNIRAALIDRYGGKDVAIGGKQCKKCKGTGMLGGRIPEDCGLCGGTGWALIPGPLHGLRADMWSALAVGLTAMGR